MPEIFTVQAVAKIKWVNRLISEQEIDPCLSLDSPFLDSSALEDLYQFCAI